MNSKSSKFHGKKLLAMDFGKKFSGLATFKVGSDPYPLSYGRLAFETKEKLLRDLSAIIDEEFIDIFILGVPYFTDGSSSKLTKEIQAFGKEIQEQFPKLNYYEQDETLSTYEAEERMKNSPEFNFKVDLKRIDALAATIILEDFLKNNDN